MSTPLPAARPGAWRNRPGPMRATFKVLETLNVYERRDFFRLGGRVVCSRSMTKAQLCAVIHQTEVEG